MAIILKISVRGEFSSSFDIISGAEDGGILFLQIAVAFGVKKKKKRMRVKENIAYRDFFTNKKTKFWFN